MKSIFYFTNLKRKLPFILSTLFFCSFSIYDSSGQITIWSESFETNGNTVNGGDGRYSSPNDFHDGVNDDDYWGRVRGADEEYFLTDVASGIDADAQSNYGGYNGSFFYAGEDLNDVGGLIGSPDGQPGKQLLFSNINIAGATNMVFKGLFARGETDPCGSSTYDDEDHILVYYTVDAGVEVEALCFYHDAECNVPGDISNEPLYMDPNCDGDGGEGTILTNALTEFSFAIAGIGSALEIRVEVVMEAGGEEIAMDFFRVESDTPLPVELHGFRGEKVDEVTELNWYTSSEIQNDFFAVERSKNGDDFKQIGTVKGQGNASTGHSYTFVDKRPKDGINYYRLKQVNWGGSFDYTDVISVIFENSRTALSVAPNPFKDIVTVSLEKASNKDINIEIYNLLGQKVRTETFKRDQIRKDIDLSTLEGGTYILKVGEGADRVVKRILKF